MANEFFATRSVRGSDGPTDHFAPYLSPEVHRIIARYIDSADLPGYRLVSKATAEIGAEELFSTITFHCSLASIARVEAIKACDYLNKHVKTLTWDTNFWIISFVRDLHEWTRYFNIKAQYHKDTMVGEEKLADRYAALATSRAEWERYLDSVQDERLARKPSALYKSFVGFRNLRKLRVLNGGLTRAHRGIRKSSELAIPPAIPAVYFRGESFHNNPGRSFGMQGSQDHNLQPSSAHVFVLFGSFTATSWHITKLRLDAVHWGLFTYETPGAEALQHVTSLHLKVTAREESRWGAHRGTNAQILFRQSIREARWRFSKGFLKDFLLKLMRLRSLKLDFGGHVYDDGLLYLAPATVDDVFLEHHTWPELEKLGLRGVDTTPEALSSLLERQRSTLKVLKLHNICIAVNEENANPEALDPMMPPEFLAKLREVVTLQRARLTGYLSSGLDAVGGTWDSWDLSSHDLAHATAIYLVDGGDCPLNDGNKSSDKKWTPPSQHHACA
jgi:hypothetical protein